MAEGLEPEAQELGLRHVNSRLITKLFSEF
jgi:hypothetical protein